MKFHSKRATALASLALSSTMILSACGGDDGGDSGSGGSEGGGDVKLTMLPKNLGNPYFDTSTKGAMAAAEELGVDMEEVGPQEATPDAQVQYINTAAQQATDALVLSANDPEALCDAIGEARDAGTKVVTFDADTNPECRDLFINQATAEDRDTAEEDRCDDRQLHPAGVVAAGGAEAEREVDAGEG